MCSPEYLILSFKALLIALLISRGMNAQSLVPVELEIRESSLNGQVINHIIKATNNTNDTLRGVIKINSEAGIISRPERKVLLLPGDSLFVSYKLTVETWMRAGRRAVSYDFVNDDGIKLANKEIFKEVEEKSILFLMADPTPVMVVHPIDSVHVQVTVSNNGNTVEKVTMVFNVPNLRGAHTFTEQCDILVPGESKRFLFSFVPSDNLLASSQFPVYVTGMKGSEKTLFGNKTISVQNVHCSGRYIDTPPYNSTIPGITATENAISLSYKQYNSSLNMIQVHGRGHLNLPAGYLQLQGNINKYNAQSTPLVTNTSLMYKLYENEFIIGNISEQTELPMFGRGAKAMFSDRNSNKRLIIGAIDQNFNLLGSQPWFSNYYSIYLQSELGANNHNKGAKISYIYQKNPYESAYFHVAGMELRSGIGQNWNIFLKGYGTIGKYSMKSGNRFSGAAEFFYRGRITRDFTLNGEGYFSDAYFPGNRKGTASFSQGANIKLSNELHLSGSVSYSKIKPKSYGHSYNYQSENSYGNITMSLPAHKRLSSLIYYQHQGESNPSRVLSPMVPAGSKNLQMKSHRLGWQWGWQSRDIAYSLLGTLDGGFFKNPLGDDMQYQTRATISYSYQWLDLNATYQNGAYYLYEYMMSRGLNERFRRFTASASANKKLSNKLFLSAGINYSKDKYQGGVPSAHININYIPKSNINLFLNSYWYRYAYGAHGRGDIFNAQVGVTFKLGGTQPMSGRKSRVAARIFYDINANGKFDDDEKTAGKYLLNIGEKVFISDEEGKVSYSLVPYGKYCIKPFETGRWFFDPKEVIVNGSRTVIDIPLKESGSLQGGVKYLSDKQYDDFIPRYEGLMFTIMNSSGSVIQNVVTDNKGKFLTFLPVGEYTIILDQNTLAEHTYCEKPTQLFRVEAGETTRIPLFRIEIKKRKVNIKRFYAAQ